MKLYHRYFLCWNISNVSRKRVTQLVLNFLVLSGLWVITFPQQIHWQLNQIWTEKYIYSTSQSFSESKQTYEVFNIKLNYFFKVWNEMMVENSTIIIVYEASPCFFFFFLDFFSWALSTQLCRSFMMSTSSSGAFRGKIFVLVFRVENYFCSYSTTVGVLFLCQQTEI